MSSKLDIEKLTHDLGLKPFRFTLSEPSEGTLVLYHSPDGWADAETTYSRHKTYHSVLRNASTNELIFYKEGRDFLKNCYENSGIDCNATMTVEKLNKTTNDYDSYPAAGKFDFSTYQVDEVSVKIQMIDTSFKEKVINRATTEVDITKLQSIGSERITLAPFSIDEITIPDTSLDLTDAATISGSPQMTSPFVVPISAVTNTDFSEMQVPTTSTVNINTSSFFKESAQGRIVQLTGAVEMDLFRVTGTGSIEYTIVQVDSSNVIQNIFTLLPSPPTALDNLPDLSGSISITVNQFITLSTGDSLILQCAFTGTSVLTGGEISVNETYTGNPEKDIYAFAYYEALLRTCQLITDTNNPLYSTFFGRTDTPLTTYPSDGEIGFVTKGIYFRSDLGVTSSEIPLKLSDLFESLSGIFRLGLGVEQIVGVDKVVVEDLDYFFDSAVVLDISDKLREENIEKHVIADMFYKSIDSGYSKFEYDNNSGLFEFNTKNTWTTVIKSVFNDFKKIVKYRADGQGMRLILLAPYSVDDAGDSDYDFTKDVKGDSDIFFIDALRDGVGGFIARTDEGFDFVGGSVYAASSFNIRYSPARNLLRWGSNIKAGLIHALNTYLRWQSAEKNTTLVSRLTTESSNVVENADILVNGLTDCRWYNEKYIVKAPITVAQLNAVDAAPNGLVKLSDTKYGWILEMKTSNKDGMAEFELLRANLNFVTPS